MTEMSSFCTGFEIRRLRIASNWARTYPLSRSHCMSDLLQTKCLEDCTPKRVSVPKHSMH